jgi:hypothetical protein
MKHLPSALNSNSVLQEVQEVFIMATSISQLTHSFQIFLYAFQSPPPQTIHITSPDLTLHENCRFGNNCMFYYSLCAFGLMKISVFVSIDDYFYLTAVMGNMTYILQNEGLYISYKNYFLWRHTTLDNTLITIVQYSQQSVRL